MSYYHELTRLRSIVEMLDLLNHRWAIFQPKYSLYQVLILKRPLWYLHRLRCVKRFMIWKWICQKREAGWAARGKPEGDIHITGFGLPVGWLQLKSHIIYRTSMSWVPKTCSLVAFYKSDLKPIFLWMWHPFTTAKGRDTSIHGQSRLVLNQFNLISELSNLIRVVARVQDKSTHGQSRLVLNQFSLISEWINFMRQTKSFLLSSKFLCFGQI